VFQTYQLIPVLTARENVGLPLLLAGLDVNKYAQQIDDLLARVGLAGGQHHLPSQLSGGQQQRVAIARALVTNPAAILADEPTGALDFRTGQELMRLLRQLCKEQNCTVVVVTHEVHVATHADRVVFLRDGSVVNEVKVSNDPRASANVILEMLNSLMHTEEDVGYE